MGWYTDKELTTPFYKDNPVTSDMTVYAKYTDLLGETLNLTSFALLDQSPDLSFEIVKTADATVAPSEAFTLIPKDGSDLIPLKWTVNGDIYTVTADGGFNKGCSYELNLADGYNFKDKPDTIRTATFTIKMEETENLQMSDDIIYIQDTDEISYEISGKTYEVLTPSLVPESGGEFNYADAGNLQVDDIICFYITTSPEIRDYTTSSYSNDPEVYVKVEAVDGTTVTFGAIDAEDMDALYKIPDNFPILVDELPAGDEGTVNISALDLATYKLIMGEAEGTVENAKERVNVGDFISLYVSTDSITGESAVYFGEVTAYDKSTGTITYKKSSAQAIKESMDLYVTPDISGDDLITPEEKEEIEEQIYEQVQASNFATEAAFMLADLATKTDGFRNMDSVQVFFKDEKGNPLPEEEIALLNLGGSFELTDDVELTVELITRGDQLHFKDGVQLAIGIDASFEVETEDDGKIVIDLSATFVEEVSLGFNVKGDLVYKEILGFIPIPIGVSVNAGLDVKNYIAVSFNINIYTVEKEDEETWDKVKKLLNDTKVGEILDKIEEIQNKIDQAKGTAEQLIGYAKEIDELWKLVPEDATNKEEWAELGKALGKTNITKDLMDMMNLATDTSLGAEAYAESVNDLMQKYSEMLQTETDWVKIVDKEMFKNEICVFGVAIKTSVSFVVRLDVNIAMGSFLEYEVGKRYNFWFKIGLFKPKAGTETMDLLDERFAFQFYVMGKLGAKMGIAASIEAGIGSAEIASVGITAELGPYIKLYGFFIYEYEKMRPANTSKWEYQERMAGALYFEFGLYIIVSFDAEALGLFEYSYDFLDEEYPLAHAGEKRYQYAFAYEPQPDEKVRIVDEDGNSTNGITMKIPDSILALSYVDLDTGILGSEAYSPDNYNITFSNPNFSMDENGIISVNVPEGVQYIECDATITYLHKKLAFSKYDMSVTVPLVWTNLSSKELVEYFTASVRVGNDEDGYQTIWSKRVKKNEEFDLPSIDTVKKLINYSNYDYEGTNMKYESISDYSVPSTKNLRIYTDATYNIEVTYKDYSVTVTGIEQADGTKINKTYTTRYGKAFDFSDLANTGTNVQGTTPENTAFTKFATLTAEKPQEDIGKGELPTYDLTAPVEGKLAIAIAQNKVNPVAIYVDDSITVTFQFDGISHPDVIQKIKKGTEPDIARIDEIVSEQGMAIKATSPALGRLFANTRYTVNCGELTGPAATISFEENGGSEVADITKIVGSIIGTLPTPTRAGYNFDGWYTDPGLTTAFAERKMPSESITLYARWTAASYTVTLNANGGSFGGDENTRTINVIYGSSYGTLPTPARSGKSFAGWYTATEGGTEVKADTIVQIPGNHTLYARWVDLKVIDKSAIIFAPVTATYQRGVGVPAEYALSEDYAHLGLDGFTFEYRLQSDPDAEIDVPVVAGTYDMVVKRAADNTYAQFEYRYTAVVRINKATRTLDTVKLDVKRAGYTFLDLKPNSDVMNELDISPKAKFTYNAIRTDGKLLYPADSGSSKPGSSYVGGLKPATDYYVTITVTDDPNYEDASSEKGYTVRTLDAPTESWLNHTESLDTSSSVVYISTPGQLAMLAKEINSGNLDGKGLTFVLTNDIDLTGYRWEPIGHEENAYDVYYFKGIFDGAGHTIRGLYVKNQVDYEQYQGLFALLHDATVRNLIIEESYIGGNGGEVGGIAGNVIGATLIENCITNITIDCSNSVNGGIVGYLDSSTAIIKNCVNYGNIAGYGYVGGIAGSIWAGTVINCANYGKISGQLDVGGIAGRSSNGTIINSVNFGDVESVYIGGTPKNTGGIVGENERKGAYVYNCYTTGTVKGSGTYVGAVVGRNTGDDGKVNQCYYLAGSATCDGNSRNGLGTEKGSVTDGDKGYQVASFTSATSALSRDCNYGRANLMTALNNYVDAYRKGNSGSGIADWVEGENGYPVPKGLPTYTQK